MIVCCRRPPHRKYFLQILAGATNAEIVTDPKSAVLPGDVYVDITAPDGSHAAVPLHQTGAGIFEGSAAAGLPGIYPARFLATGTTRHGSPFTRDVLRTGAVWRGGDGTPPSGTTDPRGRDQDLCRLIACLQRSDSIRSDMA